jgi:hypothetical protein
LLQQSHVETEHYATTGPKANWIRSFEDDDVFINIVESSSNTNNLGPT